MRIAVDLTQSSKRLVETKISDLRLGSEFKVWHDKIETPGDGLIIFQGMQDQNAESIKSPTTPASKQRSSRTKALAPPR